MKRSVVLGTGSFLPRRELTNADLERMVDTSDEWITSRTGILTRRIAGKGEENYRLAAGAARRALEMAGLEAGEIDLIVVATMTPHMTMPSCACFVQAEIGAQHAFAYDLNAACSGYLFALDMADKYVLNKPDMNILVIGSETLSARVNWQDRNTCILFGDGAGACVLSGREHAGGIIDSRLFTDGNLWELLYMHSPRNLNPDLVQQGDDHGYIRMTGRDVFKFAVRAMEESVTALLQRNGMTAKDIGLMIPHQANIRIIHKLMERLGVPEEKVYINVNKYGNTSAASIPIALDEANRQGLIQRGDLVLFCAFGGGFTWGSLLMRW
ncbi:3-oxoacyl-[acyl-carrier-protein] synthase, KASIII [hydrothermal vent metagenome]|uniref:beta-ketoacyl-[acyl-carrier-protein] synthase III n=1 Tax=hydrothermal vent metagenome TaxID=652676 RepID=A0A3B0VQE4_9ZZZZ